MKLAILTAAALGLIPAIAMAAPPEKAPKNPPVHLNGVLSVNTVSPDRLVTYMVGPLAMEDELGISGFTATNFGDEPVAVHFRAYWPDPSTPPSVEPDDDTYPVKFCTEDFGEGRIFNVFDEPLRVVVPANDTVNVAIPGETTIPGQYYSPEDTVNMPQGDWCLIAFFPDSIYPLPTGPTVVDVRAWAKVEKADIEP